MRTIAFVLAVACAPGVALACDSESPVNTFILQDGSNTRISGSVDDLIRIERKMKQTSGPALFTRIDGKDYVISDPAVVDRAREIFSRSDPMKNEKRALKQEAQDLRNRQHQLDAHGGDDAAQAELDAEERALEARREKHDGEREHVSDQMTADLTDLAREAIRAGKAR